MTFLFILMSIRDHLYAFLQLPEFEHLGFLKTVLQTVYFKFDNSFNLTFIA